MDGMGKGKKSEIKINKYKSELKSFYSHMPPIFFIFSVENEDFENMCSLKNCCCVSFSFIFLQQTKPENFEISSFFAPLLPSIFHDSNEV